MSSARLNSAGTQVVEDAQARPTVLIFTLSLLEGSMTFIKSQAEALKRYSPIFVGSHRVDGIELPPEQIHVVNAGLFGVVREAIFRKFGRAPRLARELRSYAPIAVHGHFGTSGPSAMYLARMLGIPFVLTFHGYDATVTPDTARGSHRGREMLKSKKDVSREASAIIAVSDYIRHRLIDQGYPSDKIVVLRNGIDIGYFEPSTDSAREPIILFVGRFVEKKGAIYLIEAAQHLKNSGVEFELVFIGDGPLDAEIKRAASDARLPCSFKGFLPIDQVREWIGKARVVAIPSVTAANGDCEGLPTALLEAQAMETPVVATRHSGIPEGMVEGVTGLLADERDAAELADHLRVFLESPETAGRFGRAGRRFVCEEFDMRKQVAALEDLYTNVCRQHEANRGF